MAPLFVLISTMAWPVTSYRSVPEQTDASPFITSTGEHTFRGGCAVSQDLLKNKTILYGDFIYVDIPSNPALSRMCYVNDTMNSRIKHAVDFWVATKAEERAVNVRRGYVYKLIKSPRDLTKSIETYKTTKRLIKQL